MLNTQMYLLPNRRNRCWMVAVRGGKRRLSNFTSQWFNTVWSMRSQPKLLQSPSSNPTTALCISRKTCLQ